MILPAYLPAIERTASCPRRASIFPTGLAVGPLLQEFYG